MTAEERYLMLGLSGVRVGEWGLLSRRLSEISEVWHGGRGQSYLEFVIELCCQGFLGFQELESERQKTKNKKTPVVLLTCLDVRNFIYCD